MSNKCKSLSNTVDELYDEIEDYHDRIFNLEVDMYDQQQRSRRNNIEIAGIPNYVSDRHLENTCIGLLNNIVHLPIDPREIDACHRLPSKGTKTTIIRFMTRKRCDEVKENRNRLKDVDLRPYGFEETRKLYINDNLSPHFKSVAYHCRCLKREEKIDQGFVKIKRPEKGWTKIKHEQNLFDLFPDYFSDE